MKLNKRIIDRFIQFCDNRITWGKVVEFSNLNPGLGLTPENKKQLFRLRFNED
jgi:hypothetical protein